jgi:hypothetical protein
VSNSSAAGEIEGLTFQMVLSCRPTTNSQLSTPRYDQHRRKIVGPTLVHEESLYMCSAAKLVCEL